MARIIETFADALEFAEPRPHADVAKQHEKKNYAERLSRGLATLLANGLRPSFPGIIPDRDGSRQESPARTSKGVKKLDVNFSTPELGLGLGVSIKTVNYRDPRTNRYTKNYTRIDNELRAEAMDYHERQPYAVLVGVVFLPADACEDGSERQPSCFGSAVRSFRHRAKRGDPKDDVALFERVFLAPYEYQGDGAPDVWFFDVQNAPPKNGLPMAEFRLSFDELLEEIKCTYDMRNDPPFDWATDGEH